MSSREQTLVAPAAIAETLHWLRRRRARVVLHAEGALAGWPARLIACDPGHARCTVSVAALADVRETLAVGALISLTCHEAGRAIATATMPIRERLDDGESLRLIAALPVEMRLTRERGERRVALDVERLPVTVALTGGTGMSVRDGCLVDLSVSGCRVAGVAADELVDHEAPLSVRLIFPNDEVVALRAQVIRREPNGDPRATVALVFVDTDAALARRLWRITAEIERETARRARRQCSGESEGQKSGNGLPLAPSPLFLPASAVED